MTPKVQQGICARAVEVFGPIQQKIKCIEELGELTQSLAKHLTTSGNLNSVHEEIADVEIMLMQMRFIFDPKEIDDWKNDKLKRLDQKL